MSENYHPESSLFFIVAHNELHWVPLVTSSVRMNTRLQRADFLTPKSLTSMNVNKFG